MQGINEVGSPTYRWLLPAEHWDSLIAMSELPDEDRRLLMALTFNRNNRLDHYDPESAWTFEIQVRHIRRKNSPLIWFSIIPRDYE